jgi:hypothetical protein
VASDEPAAADERPDPDGAAGKEASPNADGRRRDRPVPGQFPGQFGHINAPRKASQGKPAPDKSPAAKPAKPSISAGVWRRPFSQPDR